MRPAPGERFRDHRPHQPGAALVSRRVQRRDGQRLDQPLVQAVMRQQPTHRVGRLRRPQPQQPHVIGQSGSRHPARWQEHPPGQPPFVRPHRPTLAAAHIDEREHRRGRAGQRMPRSDPVEKRHRRAVARQQQMVAVVDPAAEFTVEIRPATPATRRPGLIDHHRSPGLGEGERRRQACQPATDHMDAAGHIRAAFHPKANRTRISIFSQPGTETRLSTCFQPRRSNRPSTAA